MSTTSRAGLKGWSEAMIVIDGRSSRESLTRLLGCDRVGWMATLVSANLTEERGEMCLCVLNSSLLHIGDARFTNVPSPLLLYGRRD